MKRTIMLFALLLSPLSAGAQQGRGIAGTYTNGPATFVLGTDRSYAVKAGEAVMIFGRYDLLADTLVITDEGGPYACPAAPGRYVWQRTEQGLTFQLVSDACPGMDSPYSERV